MRKRMTLVRGDGAFSHMRLLRTWPSVGRLPPNRKEHEMHGEVGQLYYNDPHFKTLVDAILSQLLTGTYSAWEVRAAASLALTKYHSETCAPVTFSIPPLNKNRSR